ncbi:MAG: MerR family transcriptional regulator [Lachnospiraceae bacterium]|nr:MerR family transcriptional regulator [Lachnospiraceae bacterium]
MYSAKEAAEITGLSTATLRYYEKEQLLPQIARTSQNYRQYSDSDIEWIKMVQCLRMANVPIQSLKKYIALLVQGGKTMEQRYGMVQDYITDIQEQMNQLQNVLALTRRKTAFYEKLLKEPSSKDLMYLEEWELFKNEEGKEE